MNVAGLRQGLGVVRYVGDVHFSTNGGIWVGVELLSAEGKNDGTVQGWRYFVCEKNHGVLAKLESITPIKKVIILVLDND